MSNHTRGLMDESQVVERSALDNEYQAMHPKPWLFLFGNAIVYFDTEGEACKAQRTYRGWCGFDPVTGEAA